MSALKNFVAGAIKKAPQVFPWIALFHIGMLLYSLYAYGSEPFPSAVHMQWLWLVGYTFFWIFCCDLRQWALYGYVLLTLTNVVLHFVVVDRAFVSLYLDALFPTDLLFSFFLLYYFKRFQRKAAIKI